MATITEIAAYLDLDTSSANYFLMKTGLTKDEPWDKYRVTYIRFIRKSERLAEARADLALTQKKKLEWDMARKSGNLVDTDLMVDDVAEMLGAFRTKIRAIPAAIADSVQLLATAQERAEYIQQGIDAALADCRDWLERLPERAAKIAEGIPISDEALHAVSIDGSPPAQAERKRVGRPRKVPEQRV